MNRLKVSGLAVLILTVGYQSLLLAESPAAVEPRDALVLVTVRSFMGRFAGGGFVIGDGTLVVTAYHLVFEQSKQGRHEMAGMVFAASSSQAGVPTRLLRYSRGCGTLTN